MERSIWAAKIIAAGLVLAIIGRWLVYAVPVIRKQRAESMKLEPLINEARSLNINYESVLAYPYQTIGKPAIWCIQNRGPHEIYYEGNGAKRLMVEQADSMPLFVGSKHGSCTDMLVIISSVTSRSFTDQGVTFVGVKFLRLI